MKTSDIRLGGFYVGETAEPDEVFEVYAMKPDYGWLWLIYRDKSGESFGESVEEFAAHVTREVPKPEDWADGKTIGQLCDEAEDKLAAVQLGYKVVTD
jgi:hypothetical protein